MMVNSPITPLLEASIELELGIAALYRVFSELYAEDREFWSQLHLEEKSHATLLRAALDSYSKREILPPDILPASLEKMVQVNTKVADMLDRCKKAPPARRSACELAIAIENEIGEKHYNRFMEKAPESTIEEVFQQLNRNDKDHAERIAVYLGGMDG